MNVILEIFSYPFMIRALIVGAMVSLCASLLGVSLVLKRFSMIGDGLSHVGFGALALATVLNVAPLALAVPVVIVAAFLLLRLTENSRTKGDAAIALISVGSLAIGVMAISLTTGVNIDVYNYMFGSVLAISDGDLYVSVVTCAVVIILFVLYYNRIFCITFDENFARATGTRSSLYNTLLAVLTAVIIVIGMRLVGSLLISALIIFPALSSMKVFKSFRGVTISAAVVSIVCFLTGIVISYVYSTPAGASIVTVNIAGYILFTVFGFLITRRKPQVLREAGRE